MWHRRMNFQVLDATDVLRFSYCRERKQPRIFETEPPDEFCHKFERRKTSKREQFETSKKEAHYHTTQHKRIKNQPWIPSLHYPRPPPSWPMKHSSKACLQKSLPSKNALWTKSRNKRPEGDEGRAHRTLRDKSCPSTMLCFANGQICCIAKSLIPQEHRFIHWFPQQATPNKRNRNRKRKRKRKPEQSGYHFEHDKPRIGNRWNIAILDIVTRKAKLLAQLNIFDECL